MSLDRLLSQTVTVERHSEGGDDEFGNASDVWAPGVTYPARLEQVRGDEVTLDRDTQVSDWRLFLPAGAAIDGHDRVTDEDDRVFEVVGPPAIERTPRGPHHIEARLRHIEG